MKSRDGIQSEEITTCLLCQAEGVPTYSRLRDSLFHVPGVWGLLQCTQCGLVWLNPRPIPEETGRLYATYYTHALCSEPLAKIPKVVKDAILAGVFGYDQLEKRGRWKLAGRLMSLVPTLKDMVGLGIMGLKASERARVVDVGCGDGQFLAQMRDLGWEVLGIEPDAEAARLARGSFGVPVIVGTLETASLPEDFCEIVTMRHVIEHVPDPIGFLKETRRILKPGGRLIVLTPNIESLGHKLFGRTWPGLDPPRHFHVFASNTLRACGEASGFSIEDLRTTARNARFIWSNFRHTRRDRKGSEAGGSPGFLPEGFLFQALEEMIRLVWKAAGEELLLVAVKP